jgi:hypothetical protein
LIITMKFFADQVNLGGRCRSITGGLASASAGKKGKTKEKCSPAKLAKYANEFRARIACAVNLGDYFASFRVIRGKGSSLACGGSRLDHDCGELENPAALFE